MTLTTSQSELEAEWRRTPEKATDKWEKYRELEEENLEVMEAYSDMKMVECSTEAVPQFYFLVIFTIASVILPRTSGLGLLKDESGYSWAFLVFSLTMTYVTIIMSILSAMDIRKNGQLGFKQKAILGLSATFQLLAHLCQMVPIAILALPRSDNPAEDGSDDATFTPIQAGLLLLLPLLVRWIANAFSVNSRFPDLPKKKQFLHVLANSWVTIPLRHKDARKQIQKDSEIRKSLLLAGLNIILSFAMTSAVLSGRRSSSLTSDSEFYMVLILPGAAALLSHVLGSFFLYLYYKTSHPWRELFIWQRKEQRKKGVTEDVPCWEQVS